VSIKKELSIVSAILLAIVAVILIWQPQSKISFFDLKIINDTNKTVTLQPCWDLVCLDTHGLPSHVLAPGHSVVDGGHFPTDRGGGVVVAIVKPGGKPGQFSSCLITGFAPNQNTGTIRVSHARKCYPQPGQQPTG
jgi:hypothetical protein